MDIFVRPRVRQGDVSCVLPHIGESVEYVGEVLGGDELWVVFGTIDTPVTDQDVNSRLYRTVYCLT